MSEANITQASVLEDVVIRGDLSKLSQQEKLVYYKTVCDAVGVNPATRPFEYLTLKGRVVLYARRECTEQLRKRDNISICITAREKVGDTYVVIARAELPSGRSDESTGVVSIKGLQGDDLANALMKAETKAKRRVTLSICGMGILDETELDTIPDVKQPRQRQIESRPASDHKPNGKINPPDVSQMAEEDFITAEMADYLIQEGSRHKYGVSAICKRFGVADLLQLNVEQYCFLLAGFANIKTGGLD